MVLASSTAALATARIGEKNPLFARGTAGPDGAQLELHNSADGATFSVELRVVGPAQLLLARDAGAPCVEQSWSMVRGVAVHATRDVLLQAVQWVRRKRDRRVNAALLPAADVEGADLLRQVCAVARTVAHAAVDRCDPVAHRLA